MPAKLCASGRHRYRGRGPCPACKQETNDRYVSAEYRRNRELCLIRDGHRCTKCGSPRKLTAHHKIPARAGGGDGLANLVTMCDRCNKEADALFRAGVVA